MLKEWNLVLMFWSEKLFGCTIILMNLKIEIQYKSFLISYYFENDLAQIEFEKKWKKERLHWYILFWIFLKNCCKNYEIYGCTDVFIS